jgi:hypothetical protein
MKENHAQEAWDVGMDRGADTLWNLEIAWIDIRMKHYLVVSQTKRL